ncbi:hypothetical protein Ciccas_002704 [Cichlidogyrus casuarinus]|uniref:Uncharacterized protein n=1 Tax=Cichlidogyrus casuarinus TaxID=1844966 RepID=A0ABD2QGG7_9PLAT
MQSFHNNCDFLSALYKSVNRDLDGLVRISKTKLDLSHYTSTNENESLKNLDKSLETHSLPIFLIDQIKPLRSYINHPNLSILLDLPTNGTANDSLQFIFSKKSKSSSSKFLCQHPELFLLLSPLNMEESFKVSHQLKELVFADASIWNPWNYEYQYTEAFILAELIKLSSALFPKESTLLSPFSEHWFEAVQNHQNYLMTPSASETVCLKVKPRLSQTLDAFANNMSLNLLSEAIDYSGSRLRNITNSIMKDNFNYENPRPRAFSLSNGPEKLNPSFMRQSSSVSIGVSNRSSFSRSGSLGTKSSRSGSSSSAGISNLFNRRYTDSTQVESVVAGITSTEEGHRTHLLDIYAESLSHEICEESKQESRCIVPRTEPDSSSETRAKVSHRSSEERYLFRKSSIENECTSSRDRKGRHESYRRVRNQSSDLYEGVHSWPEISPRVERCLDRFAVSLSSRCLIEALYCPKLTTKAGGAEPREEQIKRALLSGTWWGCTSGEKDGDPQIKAMLLWIASAIVATLPHLQQPRPTEQTKPLSQVLFCTEGDARLDHLPQIVNLINDRGLSAGKLLRTLLDYCHLRRSQWTKCADIPFSLQTNPVWLPSFLSPPPRKTPSYFDYLRETLSHT